MIKYTDDRCLGQGRQFGMADFELLPPDQQTEETKQNSWRSHVDFWTAVQETGGTALRLG